MNISNGFLVLISLVFCHALLAQNEQKTIEIAELSMGQVAQFTSEILGEQRTLNIYLPHGYSSDSRKKYPVIYLLDGSMDEDFIHVAGLVQFGASFSVNMLPESIVVGIANVHRKRDFTFPKSNAKREKKVPKHGKSANFINFIIHEVQPFIDNQYRTNAQRTLIGRSLGGLLATEILFKKPNAFDNYIIVSPSLWWDQESLLKEIPAAYASKKSIFIAVGKEGKIMERTAKQLYDKLNALQRKKTKVHFEYLEKNNHGDILHLAVYQAFQKIFK